MSTCIHARKCVIDSDTDEHRRKQTPSDTRTCCPMGVALSLKSCTLWAQKFEALNPSRSAFLQLLSSFIALFSCSPVPPFLFLRLLFVRKRVSLMNFDSSKVKLCPTITGYTSIVTCTVWKIHPEISTTHLYNDQILNQKLVLNSRVGIGPRVCVWLASGSAISPRIRQGDGWHHVGILWKQPLVIKHGSWTSSIYRSFSQMDG